MCAQNEAMACRNRRDSCVGNRQKLTEGHVYSSGITWLNAFNSFPISLLQGLQFLIWHRWLKPRSPTNSGTGLGLSTPHHLKPHYQD